MSFWQKFTYPLFESVCVRQGHALRPEAHRARFARSYQIRYGQPPPFDLFEGIEPEPGLTGVHKLRICYGRKGRRWEFIPYTPRQVNSLRIVSDALIQYPHKTTDRRGLSRLYRMKGDCDDVLIAREGRVTDTSYSNIAFLLRGRWFTPDPPLLAGTHRAVLLEEGSIEACPIRVSEVPEFEGFQLINAMMEFRPDFHIPITQIRLK